MVEGGKTERSLGAVGVRQAGVRWSHARSTADTVRSAGRRLGRGLQGAEKDLQGGGADPGEVLDDGGQPRREVGGLGDVVETDDADVAGHSETGPVEGLEHAHGHLVVGDEDGSDLLSHGPALGQAAAEFVARAGAPVTGQGSGHLPAGVEEFLAPAVHTCFGLEPVGATGDMVHGAVAEAEQMADGIAGPLLLVDTDDREPGPLTALDRHQGAGPGQVGQGVHEFPLGCDGHTPLDGLLDQMVQGLGDPVGAGVVDGDDAEEVPGFPGSPLYAREGLGRPEQGGVHSQGTEHVGTPGHECACGGVGVVVELGDGAADPYDGLLADVRVAVDHTRDGLVGDTGDLRDVGHDRVAATRRGHGAFTSGGEEM